MNKRSVQNGTSKGGIQVCTQQSINPKLSVSSEYNLN